MYNRETMYCISLLENYSIHREERCWDMLYHPSILVPFANLSGDTINTNNKKKKKIYGCRDVTGGIFNRLPQLFLFFLSGIIKMLSTSAVENPQMFYFFAIQSMDREGKNKNKK
jgi:hypothetical protein